MLWDYHRVDPLSNEESTTMEEDACDKAAYECPHDALQVGGTSVMNVEANNVEGANFYLVR